MWKGLLDMFDAPSKAGNSDGTVGGDKDFEGDKDGWSRVSWIYLIHLTQNETGVWNGQSSSWGQWCGEKGLLDMSDAPSKARQGCGTDAIRDGSGEGSAGHV